MNLFRTVKINNINDDLNKDKYVYFNLEQSVKTFEILSLKLSQQDFYQRFNANFGVLIGRVLTSNSIGVPNAKVSIFIPIDENDKNDGDVFSIYPYSKPTDLNNDGKRYNLLPRVSTYSSISNSYKPSQPFGSFPIIEEVIINDKLLNIYKKYYKYATVTNSYGDYMIFGIPIGTQTIHLSVDITDISQYSLTPTQMVHLLGYSPTLFSDDIKYIKNNNDLTLLPNIELQDIAVDIVPFWGDKNNFQIGITRQDFKIRSVVNNTFTIFGSTMMMNERLTYGYPSPKDNFGFYTLSTIKSVSNTYDIRYYKSQQCKISVFTFLPKISVEDIENGNFDPLNDIVKLTNTDYYEYNNGDFVLNIQCNKTKKITSSDGTLIIVDDNNPNGVFTEFYGMLLIEFEIDKYPLNVSYGDEFNEDGPPHTLRGRFKIPQSYGLRMNSSDVNNDYWRKEYFKFELGKYYSIAQFLPTKAITKLPSTPSTIANRADSVNRSTSDFIFDKFEVDTNFTTPQNNSYLSGLILKVYGNKSDTDAYLEPDTINVISANTDTFIYDFPYNITGYTGNYFGGQWLNLSLVFPNVTWCYRGSGDRNYNVADVYFNDWEESFFVGNDEVAANTPLIGDENGVAWYLKGDAFQTTFIELTRSEINKLNNTYIDGRYSKGLNAGLYNDSLVSVDDKLDISLYKYRTPLLVSGARDYDLGAWDINYKYYSSNTNASAYIFKGIRNNDCIKKLFKLNLI